MNYSNSAGHNKLTREGNMAPSKPPRSLKIAVPRQGSKRISSSLAAVVKEKAAANGIRFQGNGPKALALNPAKGARAENASEWNSLLVHARAERGPQFDVGTQLFHVDKGSELYFDPTPLVPHEERNGTLPMDHQHSHPHPHQYHHPHHQQQQQQQPQPSPRPMSHHDMNLGTPSHLQDHNGPYPFMASQMQNTPSTPRNQFSMPMNAHGQLVTPTHTPGMMPPFPQNHLQHNLPTPYSNGSNQFMGNTASPAMNGMVGPGAMNMNGLPPHMAMMNGNSPSPSRNGFPGGNRGYPPIGMNMYGS